MVRLPGPGEVVDEKYLIEEQLGQGGMGIVFAARNLAGNFPVAIKWLLPEHADNQSAVARFRREAQMAAYVRSRNVVQIYDVGVELPYFVMERLQGSSLRDFVMRCGSDGVPLNDLERILLPVLAGVSAAHRTRTPSGQAVIHRDLKPDNVFLAELADGITPIVLDFGIARLAEAVDSVTMNTTNMILGTPQYMAREQFFDQERIGPWTDVHALGVIIYEMVAGRRPYEQSAGQTPWDLVMKVSLGQYEPVVHVRQAFHDARLAHLDAVIAKAMAPEIEDRYQSVAQLSADLSPVLKALSQDGPATMMSDGGLPGMSPGMSPPGALNTPPRVAPLAVRIHNTRRPGGNTSQSGRVPHTLSPVVTTLAEQIPADAQMWPPDVAPAMEPARRGKSIAAVLAGVVAAAGLVMVIEPWNFSPAPDGELDSRPPVTVPGDVSSGPTTAAQFGGDAPSLAAPGSGAAPMNNTLNTGLANANTPPAASGEASGWEDGTVDSDVPAADGQRGPRPTQVRTPSRATSRTSSRTPTHDSRRSDRPQAAKPAKPRNSLEPARTDRPEEDEDEPVAEVPAEPVELSPDVAAPPPETPSSTTGKLPSPGVIDHPAAPPRADPKPAPKADPLEASPPSTDPFEDALPGR